jgi:CheY-like chemotaxis protein
MGLGLNEEAICRLLERIESDHTLHHIPQVIITQADDVDRAVRFIEMGVEDYLRLPVHPVLWRARIESNLNKKRLHEQQELRQETIRNTLLPLLVDLSAEKNLDKLLENILEKAKQICNADAGALYLRDEDELKFVVVRNDSLNMTMGGTTGVPIPFASLHLHDEAGQPNYRNVATYVALEKRSVNIPDIYHSLEFDFSGLKEFDQQLGYRCVSNLTVPLKTHLDEVVGVLQLLNAHEPATGRVMPFDHDQQIIVESLSSQAAMLLDNQILVDRQKAWAKFERDLQIGHQIQIDFLPKQLPQPEGWDIAARFLPAREVAGDFYDAFSLSGGKVALVIADVCD